MHTESSLPAGVPSCLRYLLQQSGCAFGPVGVAARVPDDIAAMEEASRIAAGHVPALQWMLDHGKTGGKIYAALLLGRVDPELGRAAWNQLVTVDQWVTVAPGGCSFYRAYISDFAKQAIMGAPLVAFRDESPPPARPRVQPPPPSKLDRLSRRLEELKQNPALPS